jgi:AraC-like DNA-binding protein
MHRGAQARLERSCGPAAGDWFRLAPARPGFERVEAGFTGHAFDPHRHDSYAIGFTLRGVQAFRYRGTAAHSLPGQVFVLHPDELHDGHAGTGAGFGYRLLYVAPRLIREALGGRRALPFVRDAVSRHARIAAAIRPALADLDAPLEELLLDQVLADLADALAAADPSAARRPPAPRHGRAVDLARQLLDAAADRPVPAAALEAATGLDRYALARQFRACLGTSPHRYLVMRRLDRARALIRRGTPLAEAAAACGFADQSHMSRQFKRAFGMPPGRWAAVAGRT